MINSDLKEANTSTYLDRLDVDKEYIYLQELPITETVVCHKCRENIPYIKIKLKIKVIHTVFQYQYSQFFFSL